MQAILEQTMQQFSAWIPKVGAAVLILVAFWGAAMVARSVILRAGARARLHNRVIEIAAKTGRITIIVFGVVSALGALGIDVSAIVAGLGLTGFALGFALKDTLSNMLSGLFLLIYRPFQVNDRIKVGSFTGEVIAMDLRYTSLVDQENMILVPNSYLFNNPITIAVTKPGLE
jgi:small-conductance mechanosensitive channel